MNRRWEDTQPLDDAGMYPPCPYTEAGWTDVCGDPVAVDDSQFTYEFCPAHLLAASEPERKAS